jgi:hypothetical protein
MTTLEPFPEPTTPTEPWGDLFAKLQQRYPKVREPIVAALTALMQNPGIDVEHAKAVAAANGMRITAASVAAAERLLSRQDRHDEQQTARQPTAPATPAAAQPSSVRRHRAQAQDVDAEALIKQVVDKIQGAGNAEAERLRETMRKAIATLQAAVG